MRFLLLSFVALVVMAFQPPSAQAADFTGYCNTLANQVCTRSNTPSCQNLSPSDIAGQALCQEDMVACAEVQAEECADRCNTNPASCQSTTPASPTLPTNGTTTPTTATTPTITLPNPLGVNDPRLLIGRLIQAIISISGAIALVMFVYAGLMFLTAGGNTTQIDKAKNLMLYVILGIVVIAGAFVATNTIFTAVLTGNPVVAP